MAGGDVGERETDPHRIEGAAARRDRPEALPRHRPGEVHHRAAPFLASGQDVPARVLERQVEVETVTVRLGAQGDGALTDATFLGAVGIPTYGIPGMWSDPDGNGVHGLNERIEVRSVYVGRDYMFDLIKAYAD